MEHLAKPLISSLTPCGDDLTFSDDFDEILEARRHDDPTISQGEWVTQIKEADWREVVRISEKLLSEKSKDLRIAAWLTEALCKTEGLHGLADGYSLTFRLCSVFWDDIHPLPEDGEMEQRAGILDWLAQNMARLIRETPVTKSDKGTFSLIDLESARATAKRMEQNPRDSEACLRGLPWGKSRVCGGLSTVSCDRLEPYEARPVRRVFFTRSSDARKDQAVRSRRP